MYLYTMFVCWLMRIKIGMKVTLNKMVSLSSPSYLSEQLSVRYGLQVHQYRTRNANYLVTLPIMYVFYHNSVLPSVVGLMNELSLYVQINDPINNINTLLNKLLLLTSTTTATIMWVVELIKYYRLELELKVVILEIIKSTILLQVQTFFAYMSTL